MRAARISGPSGLAPARSVQIAWVWVALTGSSACACAAPPALDPTCRTTVLYASPSTGPGVVGPLSWGAGIAVDAEQVFFTAFAWPTADRADELHGVWRLPRDGGTPTQVAALAPSGGLGSGLALVDGVLYWSGDTTPDLELRSPTAILVAPVATGELTPLVVLPAGEVSTSIALDDTAAPHTVYFGTPSAIVSYDLATGVTAFDFAGDVRWMTAYRSTLYAITGTSPSGPAVLQTIESGSARTLVALEGRGAPFVVGEPGVLLVDGGSLLRVPLDGGPVDVLRDVAPDTQVAALGPAAVYLRSGTQLERYDIDLGTSTRIADDPALSYAYAFTVDGATLFWSSLGGVGRIDGCIR